MKPFDEHYHLCPICGIPSQTTSRVCPTHIGIIYDSKGNVVEFKDYVAKIRQIKQVKEV